MNFNKDTVRIKISEADFSEDRKYRFSLTRIWDESKTKVMFIGLNPSTANEIKSDNTITRCINFARKWGFGGMYMCNLFAYVSTDPDALITSGEDIIYNNSALVNTFMESAIVVFAWGCFKQHKSRMNDVIKMFPNAYCIQKSKEGYPKHPLYLKGDLKPIPYK